MYGKLRLFTLFLYGSVLFTACAKDRLATDVPGDRHSDSPVPQPGQHIAEFTLVAYNVENLFDADGVAIFNDYQQNAPGEPFAYTRQKLLTKLANASAVLSALDHPRGPDVILLQELEGDFTPESAIQDYDAFLAAHHGLTVVEMLGAGWKAEYAGIPSVAWLLKSMADRGMKGYHVAVGPTKPFESGIAHVNAIFSRFPIQQVFYHPIANARDIIEAELDVQGHSLWVYCNHWKSGASNPEREPIRVQNARVLRALVEQRLETDPQADIIIGGDLNSHYNHSLLFPEIETGINDVLEAQGREPWSGLPEEPSLYNLWYEIPPKARYSEVWRGRRGTLMHLIVSSGLYDKEGISYLDTSFKVGRLGGLNADAFERPISWSFAGEKGGGASDHFPLMARFRTGSFEGKAKPSMGKDALDYELRHDDDPMIRGIPLPDGSFFGEDLVEDPGDLVGRLFEVRARILQEHPLRIKVRGKEWPAYAPAPHVRERLKARSNLKLVVSHSYWKGEAQLIVEAIR